MRIPKSIIVFSIVGIFVLGITVTLLVNNKKPVPIPEIAGFVFPEPRTLTEFSLVDDSTQTFGSERFKGKWSFVFFGYTYCPDICPVTMVMLDKAHKLIKNEKLQKDTDFLFVSVDPKRDKPERLAKYTHYFNSEFRGATGSEQQLENITRQLSVVYIPPNPKDGDTNYIVDHSSSIILIDPDASAHAVFSAPHTPENIVVGFKKIVDRWEQLNAG